jgi:hypothetical protein
VTTRTKVLAAVAVLIFLVSYPFKVTVAPDWQVSVVNENGSPLAGAYVLEFADYSTLDHHYEHAICSDKDGKAHFPSEKLRASVLTRIVKCFSIVGPHSGCGSDVKIGAERLGYGDMPNDVTTAEWHGGRTSIHSQFTLHKCPDGFTAYHCNSNYEYWFGINGESAKKIAACQSEK